MHSLLAMKLHKASLTPTLKGTKTLPSVGLDDKRFSYTNALNTNLSETFTRARNSLGVRKVEKSA
jgi:hypothetical protein